MTNDEIIQEATEAVTKGMPCAFLVPPLLEVVKSQKAEIETKDTEIDILIRKKEALRDEVERLQNERIERIRELTRTVYDKEIAEAKSEAYREFADKLVDAFNKDINLYGRCTVHDVALKINNTLNELTESK